MQIGLPLDFKPYGFHSQTLSSLGLIAISVTTCIEALLLCNTIMQSCDAMRGPRALLMFRCNVVM